MTSAAGGLPGWALPAAWSATTQRRLPEPLRANPGYRVGRIRWRQDIILRRMN